jgi:hypothetical protein
MQPAHPQTQHLQYLQQQRLHMHPAHSRAGPPSCRRQPLWQAGAAVTAQSAGFVCSSSSSSSGIMIRRAGVQVGPAAARGGRNSSSSSSQAACRGHFWPCPSRHRAAAPPAAVTSAAAGLSAASGLLDMAAVSAATAASFKLLFLCGVVAWMSHRWVG